MARSRIREVALSAVLVAVAIILAARLGQQAALDVRADAFKNPGGWRLPLGEVTVFLSVFSVIFGIGALYLALY